MRNQLALVAFSFLTLWTVEISGLPKKTLEAFSKLSEENNLNISIVISHVDYATTELPKEALFISLRQKQNKDFRTVPSLDISKQDQYLEVMGDIAKKRGVGLKSQIIKVRNGEREISNYAIVNPSYIIDSLDRIPPDASDSTTLGEYSGQVIYDFVIEKPTNGVKNVTVITNKVNIKELSISDLFPEAELIEIKKVMRKLYLSIADEETFASLLSQHLEKKFDKNFQTVIGIDTFAIGKKPFANLQIANTSILVISS